MKSELMNPQGITDYLKQILDLESTLFRLKTIKAKAESELKYEDPPLEVNKYSRPVKRVVAKQSSESGQPVWVVLQPPKEEDITNKEESAVGGIVCIIIGIILILFFIMGLTSDALWSDSSMMFRSVGMILGIIMVFGGTSMMKSAKKGIGKDEYAKNKAEYDEAEARAEAKYKEELAAYNKENAAIEERNKLRVEDAKNAYNRAMGDINRLSVPIRDLTKTLDGLYREDIIFPKYRNFAAIATIYEYFASGRCDELSGTNGAYNLYESELRQNLIINKLDQVLNSLDNIKQNQYILYEEVSRTASILPQISVDIQNMLSATNSLSASALISSQCSEATAKNTEAIKYLNYIK